MTGRVAGRVALVTGASSGLGANFAKRLAREGASVVLAARRKDRLEAEVDAIRKAGGKALAVACDVTDEKSLIAAYDAAEDEFGVVDTVIANAGKSNADPVLEQSAEEFDAIFDLNVKAVFLTAREAARRMIKAKTAERGRIVAIASIAARHVVPGVAGYCASKAAVVMLARSLAKEWARQGICVNTLSPGFVETELTEDWLGSEHGQRTVQRWPRRRIMAGDSLDEALLFLCSDGAKHVTGSDVMVDDGQTM